MENDWRIVNQKEYLTGKKLIKMRFVPTEQCDHAHCAFCWEKIGECDGWLQTGYCTTDKHHWICENCFEDFQKDFGWEIQ